MIVSAVLLSLPASAALVDTEFCFEQSLAYDDRDIGDALNTSSVPAYGYRVRFIRESDHVTVNDVYLSGKPDMCIELDGAPGTVQLDDAETYTVRVMVQARIDAITTHNSVVVRDASGAVYATDAAAGLTPTGGKTYSYANGDTWTRLPATDPFHILIAAAWALTDQPRLTDGESFDLFNAGCGGSGNNSCYDMSTERLWIGSPDHKFTIGYILGLAVAHFANNHDDPQRNDSAALDGCVTGGSTNAALTNTKEYQSLAVYQGLGSFFSAVVFNDDKVGDGCDYMTPQNVDWSADGDDLDADEDNIFPCLGSPAPNQTPAINSTDYLGQKCLASGVSINRATRYDWQRLLWDYHTHDTTINYTVEEIFDTWVAADPDTWNASGDVTDVDNPYDRMLGATGQGTGGDFDTLSATHGTNR